jgi:fatty acid desaturase
MVSEGRTRQSIEWPTVLVLLGFGLAYLAVVLFHASIPWAVQLVVLVPLGGLWMSLGHELLHGHPTRWTWVNSAIGRIPLAFWIPFPRYKTLHVKHHRSDLTDPDDDPESFYVRPTAWQQAGPVRRRWFLFLRTAPGRLTVGVPRGILRFWWRELHACRDPRIAVQWLVHLVLSVALGVWLFGVVGISPVIYVFGFVLGGSACTQLRSFVEHQAVAGGTRSAVVKAGPVMSLLFLNNNLHHTHHTLPDLAWYDIPAEHERLGSDALAAQGAGLYTGGYREVLGRYLLRPFHQPEHPLLAAADRSSAVDAA